MGVHFLNLVLIKSHFIYRLKSNQMVCCDATYRLNWLNYPVFIVGLVSPTGRFSLSLVVISSHEDYSAQLNILNFVKAQGITPSFLMGKGRGKKN